MDLAEIRLDAREKADELESGFVNDTAMNRSIDQGHLYVYAKIAQAFEGHFIVPGTVSNGGLFTTTADTLEYSTPATMKKLIRVEGRSASSTKDNDFRKMRRMNIASSYLPQVDSNLFSVRIWFVPERTKMVDDADVPSVPEAYHYLISEYAAIQTLRKSGEGIFKESMDLFNLELQSLLESVEHRDQEPETMVNVENERTEFDYLLCNNGSTFSYMLVGEKLYIGFDPKFYLRGY